MEEKLKKLAPLFQKYYSPISVAVRMAQFVLESRAGQSELFKKSNNGFGIKASYPWEGDKVAHASMEADGKEHVSYFRKYPSLEESIKDHASFFTSTPYRANTAYKKAIEAVNYKDEAQALAGIYAGDPGYGQKLIAIVEKYLLTQYDVKGEWRPVLIDRRGQALGGQSKDRTKEQITTIVWHYTAVARKLRRTIESHERFWQSDRGWDRGGYHFYIDANGNLYQNYDLERITWGVASNNDYTVHISVEANSKEDYSEAQIKTRDWITRRLMRELNIPASRVKGHFEVNANSACPGYTRAEMDEWRKQLAVSPSVEVTQPKEELKNYLMLDGKKYHLVLVNE